MPPLPPGRHTGVAEAAPRGYDGVANALLGRVAVEARRDADAPNPPPPPPPPPPPVVLLNAPERRWGAPSRLPLVRLSTVLLRTTLPPTTPAPSAELPRDAEALLALRGRRRLSIGNRAKGRGTERRLGVSSPFQRVSTGGNLPRTGAPDNTTVHKICRHHTHSRMCHHSPRVRSLRLCISLGAVYRASRTRGVGGTVSPSPRTPTLSPFPPTLSSPYFPRDMQGVHLIRVFPSVPHFRAPDDSGMCRRVSVARSTCAASTYRVGPNSGRYPRPTDAPLRWTTSPSPEPRSRRSKHPPLVPISSSCRVKWQSRCSQLAITPRSTNKYV